MSFSQPITIHRQIALKVTHAMARRDYDQYVALEKAGFNVEPFGDFAHILYERLGGHYLDVGASAKIAQGLVIITSTTDRLYRPLIAPYRSKSSLESYQPIGRVMDSFSMTEPS